MSLFDFVSEEEKAEFDVHYPNVGEYDKELKLAFEKEVLGVYISGHPLEEYGKFLMKNVTAVTTDFYLDDETGAARVRDNQSAVIGGMITSKTVKVTKNNQLMAFVSLEDLVGTVEVIIFPRDYEKYQQYLGEDQKIYIRGRVSASDDQQAKLVCEKILPFDEIPKEIWIKFDSKAAYMEREAGLYQIVEAESGPDRIVIFWPSSVINSLHRAVYKNVPPRFRISHTLAAPKSTISSSRSPAYPFWIPFTRQPSVTAVRTTALTAAFIPGASPPLVSTPIVLIFLLMFKPPSLRTDNDFSE